MAQHQRRPNEVRSQGGSGFKWLLIGIAVVGVIGIGYAVVASRSAGAATGPVTIEDPTTVTQSATPMRKGANDAPVQLVEFADFQCPGCAHFATRVGSAIRAAYVDSGLVRIEYYDYPLYSIHPHAFLAARAARCAGDQGLYWEMHDILYARQTEWAVDRTPPVERYVGYAQSIGADAGDFESCLKSDRHAEAVTASGILGDQLGIRSTPTVFLNGHNVGAAWDDFGEMRVLIDQALAASRRTSPAPAGADSAAPAR